MREKKLERLNYVEGILLTARDFTTEQNYFLEKLRRHNRTLHGWGIVSGFGVFAQDNTVVVEPGIAIDCAGNEIYLNAHAECVLPKGIDKLYVIVEYSETKTRPVPSPPSSVGESNLVYSRTQEGCHVDITDVDTNSDHDGIGPGTPGCGCQHPISIAHLQKKPRGWRVTPRGRR